MGNFIVEKIVVINRLTIVVVSDGDYSRQFDWTYDLKRDVYSCYIKARENKSIGYMKRLNSYWDKVHPGFASLSDKNDIETETDIVNNEVIDEVNCTVNTVYDQATNETTYQHVTPLSTTQEKLLKVLHPIFERNY